MRPRPAVDADGLSLDHACLWRCEQRRHASDIRRLESAPARIPLGPEPEFRSSGHTSAVRGRDSPGSKFERRSPALPRPVSPKRTPESTVGRDQLAGRGLGKHIRPACSAPGSAPTHDRDQLRAIIANAAASGSASSTNWLAVHTPRGQADGAAAQDRRYAAAASAYTSPRAAFSTSDAGGVKRGRTPRQARALVHEASGTAVVAVHILEHAARPAREADADDRADVRIGNRLDDAFVEGLDCLDGLGEQHPLLEIPKR